MNAGMRLSRLGLFTPEFPDAESLHHGLARWNRRRLSVAVPHGDWLADLNSDQRMLRLEGAFIEALREHLPHARLEVVAGAGHMLHAEASRRFADLLTGFAEEIG